MAYLEDGASASGSVDVGLDSELGQTNDLKIGIHSFPVGRVTLKGTSKPASWLVPLRMAHYPILAW